MNDCINYQCFKGVWGALSDLSELLVNNEAELFNDCVIVFTNTAPDQYLVPIISMNDLQ